MLVLTAPNLVIKRSPVHAICSHLVELEYNSAGHECETLVSSSVQSMYAKMPLPNADVVLFTEGSSHVLDDRQHTGWAVAKQYVEIATRRCLDHQ